MNMRENKVGQCFILFFLSVVCNNWPQKRCHNVFRQQRADNALSDDAAEMDRHDQFNFYKKKSLHLDGIQTSLELCLVQCCRKRLRGRLLTFLAAFSAGSCLSAGNPRSLFLCGCHDDHLLSNLLLS